MRSYLAFGIVVVSLAVLGGCDEAPQLDSGHPGWQHPDCKACHGSSHNQDKDPYECAGCHGNNGAPDAPSEHTADLQCDDCHQPHSANGFPVPDACVECHL